MSVHTGPNGLNGTQFEGGELNIEEELARFEAEERKRLGLESADNSQWKDPLPSTFTAEQRSHTTLLVSGLTMAHDTFIQAGLQGIGYKVKALDCPDNEALRYGKEYGNRGQCNPTYFTVGNLVKHLDKLREGGMSTEDIVENHIFVTAGACGPCRFGTYVTEYRKALRDSGFPDFRVVLFQQTGGLKQATGDEMGLKLDPPFFLAVIKSLIVGDVLNALGYRIRPYEVVPGSTKAALDRCKEYVSAALRSKKSLLPALYKCRKELAAVKVDRTQIKPKISIIGEFWAMTTEGDGNYKLQSFLEGEGAEVDVQLVTAWLLYTIWESRYDTKKRLDLRGADGGKFGLKDVDTRKRLLSLAVADRALRVIFQSVAHILGLYDYHLADMDELAAVSHEFYDNNLRGGEGHMEVGKLILNVTHSKVNMTLSVKPFGCMPSSAVSDGVQSMITELYPEGIFLPIETSGDGAVNVYSRIQMQLFKARQSAQKEAQIALDKHGLTLDEVKAAVQKSRSLRSPFHKSPHVAGCTTADLVHDVGRRQTPIVKRAVARFKAIFNKGGKAAEVSLATKAAAAAARVAAMPKTQPVVLTDNPRPAKKEGSLPVIQ